MIDKKNNDWAMIGIFQCEIITPKNIIFSEPIKKVIIPSYNGYITILSEHCKMITSILPGIICIIDSRKKIHHFIIIKGFLHVSKKICSILSEDVICKNNFNINKIDNLINDTSIKIESSTNDIKKNYLEDLLYELISLKKQCLQLFKI